MACVLPALAAPAAQAGPLGGHSSQHQPVIGKVSRSTVALTAAFDQHCGAGDSFAWVSFRPAKLTRKHTFAGHGSSQDTFDDGWSVTESYRVSGKVTKKGVSGTYRIKDVWYQPDGTRDDACDSGKVKFGIRQAGVLAGRTSDHAPVVLELAAGRTRIDSLMIPWTADCVSGESMWNTAHLSGPLDGTGAFAASLEPPAFDWGGGKQAVPTEDLEGRITSSGATGTWRVRAKIVDVDGDQVDTCDTGPLTFRLA